MFPQLGAHNWEIRCTQFVIKKLAIGNQMQGQPWNGELLEHCILHDHLYIHTRQRTFWKKKRNRSRFTSNCILQYQYYTCEKAESTPHHTTKPPNLNSILMHCQTAMTITYKNNNSGWLQQVTPPASTCYLNLQKTAQPSIGLCWFC